MTSHIISAIIGYWRCGADNEEISELTGIDKELIKRIINNYLNKKG